jgi:hypothetical protein
MDCKNWWDIFKHMENIDSSAVFFGKGFCVLNAEIEALDKSVGRRIFLILISKPHFYLSIFSMSFIKTSFVLAPRYFDTIFPFLSIKKVIGIPTLPPNASRSFASGSWIKM